MRVIQYQLQPPITRRSKDRVYCLMGGTMQSFLMDHRFLVLNMLMDLCLMGGTLKSSNPVQISVMDHLSQSDLPLQTRRRSGVLVAKTLMDAMGLQLLGMC